MLTREQAIELNNFIFNELERNGFDNVVRDVRTRILEDIEVIDGGEQDPIYLNGLIFRFLIELLQTISNTNFSELIAQFNEVLSPDGNQLEAILFESAVAGQPFIDLRNLPDYAPIINEFEELYRLIRSEN